MVKGIRLLRSKAKFTVHILRPINLYELSSSFFFSFKRVSDLGKETFKAKNMQCVIGQLDIIYDRKSLVSQNISCPVTGENLVNLRNTCGPYSRISFLKRNILHKT